MKRFKLFIISIAIILCTDSPAFAQSPYRVSWEKDAYILGAGCAISSAGFLIYRSVPSSTASEVNQLSRTSVNGFDRSATYQYSKTAGKASDLLYGVAAAAPLLLFTDHNIGNDWQTVGLMYIEICAFTEGISMLAKGSLERFRPYAYNPNVNLGKKLSSDARRSFFSNHTAIAFSSAVFISTVYSDYYTDSKWTPYIWAGSILTASAVGYLRYEAGMHFPTDILVGAAIGSVIGYAIPWMHRVGKEDFSIIPYAPYAEYGFSFQMRF